MHRYSVHSIKKGFALIYVMLISVFVLTMVVIMFKLELNSYKYIQYRKENLQAENDYGYKREMAFSMFYDILQNGKVAMNRQMIINYTKTSSEASHIVFQDMSMDFVSDKDLFMITYPYSRIYNCYEYYDVQIVDGKMKMSLTYRK
ncbi:MAG: hypothetical protein Q8930_18670 [Bacillota bacterium]|nr:hypothetical protein [Bacillota bacterium]